MENTTLLVLTAVFVGGFALGFLFAYIFQTQQLRRVTQEILRDSEAQRKADRDAVLTTVGRAFGNLSLQALNKSSENFLNLAEQRLQRQTAVHSSELDAKKGLIDQQLNTMTQRLDQVTGIIKDFEDKRAEKLGALSSELDRLIHTSSLLQQALADNRSRGQWGERIADDILRIAGFVEGVNYTKQVSIEVDAKKKSRPDFTFNLPNGMLLHMDSKFPLDNYLRYLEGKSNGNGDSYKSAFLRDVRARIKEIKDRGYIDAVQTVDCVLIFIPNEQIYRFIHEEDNTIIDDALQQQVILCSPLTLYVVLAVIRQAIDNFKLEQASRDILRLLSEFKKQWREYTKCMDEVGSALDKAQEAYHDLLTRRQRALDKPLQRVDMLLEQKDIDGMISQ